VILVFAATCCAARVIDDTDMQSAWEQSGKFEGDIVLTDEQANEWFNTASLSPDGVVPFITEVVFNDTNKQSAREQSGKFEGDIVLTPEQRNGVVKTVSLWPNGVVPYVIDSVFDSAEINMIYRAIDDYHNKTSIRFKRFEPAKDKDYIYITGENTGCWSHVGRKGGRQELNLDRYGCMQHGTIIHELLHALGFYHMNNAPDRDNYVTINWQNIQPGKESNFNKYSASQITSFGVPYDYDSVMHSSPYAFARNVGLKTIEPKDPNANIGQREGFSTRDLEKLAIMYGDSSHTTPSLFITLTIITLNICTHLQ